MPSKPRAAKIASRRGVFHSCPFPPPGGGRRLGRLLAVEKWDKVVFRFGHAVRSGCGLRCRGQGLGYSRDGSDSQSRAWLWADDLKSPLLDVVLETPFGVAQMLPHLVAGFWQGCCGAWLLGRASGILPERASCSCTESWIIHIV